MTYSAGSGTSIQTSPTPGTPPDGDGDRSAKINTITAVLGAIVAILGFLLSIFLVEPSRLLPLGLTVLAIATAATVVAFVPIPIRRAAATLVTVVLAAGATWMWIQPNAFQTTVVQVQPTPVPTMVLTPPPAPDKPAVAMAYPPQPGTVVPFCFLAKFSASAPPGWTFAVGDGDARVDPASSRIYFEASVNRGIDGLWTAEISVGGENDGAGSDYTLYIVMLPEQLRQYLAHSHDDSKDTEGDTWWSGLGLPPGAIVAQSLDVHRGEEKLGPGANC